MYPQPCAEALFLFAMHLVLSGGTWQYGGSTHKILGQVVLLPFRNQSVKSKGTEHTLVSLPSKVKIFC